jgi:hypothetical protein
MRKELTNSKYISKKLIHLTVHDAVLHAIEDTKKRR